MWANWTAWSADDDVTARMDRSQREVFRWPSRVRGGTAVGRRRVLPSDATILLAVASWAAEDLGLRTSKDAIVLRTRPDALLALV